MSINNTKTYFVYITVDHKNNQFYLGRRYGFIDVNTDKYYGSSVAIKNIIRSRKPHQLTRHVIEIYETREDHISGERKWGKLLNVVNDDRFYNRTTCGDGGFEHLKHQKGENHPRYGVEVSEATRKKIREANIGRKWTKEDKQKMSISRAGVNHPMFGKHHSEESKEKNRNSNIGKPSPNKGKKLIPEIRQKLCKSFLFTSPEGVTYTSKDRKLFCKEQGLSYSNMVYSALHGGQKIVSGFSKGWSCLLLIESPISSEETK